MMLADPVLPAVAELTGDGSLALLRAAVAAAGGQLHDGRCAQVHYQPGHELVARYRCDITWADGRRRDDTILAATGAAHLPGAIPMVAERDGQELTVSVWRWPFDPVVVGLGTAVTPARLAPLLAGIVTEPIGVEVVAYRPTERAVVRVHGAAGEVRYVKVVDPVAVAPIAARHDALLHAGLPVPQVLAADEELGLLVLSEVAGTTFRDRLKSGRRPWPSTAALVELTRRLGAAAVTGEPRRASRTRDALAHLEVLEVLVPERIEDLRRLASACGDQLDAVAARSGAVVHGDLHEAQIVVDDEGAVTGLLDIDDCAAGDPVDDPAVLIGHLTYRSITTPNPTTARAIVATICELDAAFAARFGRRALDHTVAAVLVGLATGPFRVQLRDWPDVTGCVIDAAVRRIGA